jgi:hypothetical protein
VHDVRALPRAGTLNCTHVLLRPLPDGRAVYPAGRRAALQQARGALEAKQAEHQQQAGQAAHQAAARGPSLSPAHPPPAHPPPAHAPLRRTQSGCCSAAGKKREASRSPSRSPSPSRSKAHGGQTLLHHTHSLAALPLSDGSRAPAQVRCTLTIL